MAAVIDDVSALAQVKDGRLFIRDRRRFDDTVSRLNPDWQLEVTVKRMRATRSLLQNAYYWGVVVQMLSEHTGYTPDEVHDLLKMQFIPKKLAVCDGNGIVHGEYVLGGSTRKMNTIAFGDYLEAIRQWAAETLDVVIPDPDQDVPQVADRIDNSSRPTWYRAKRRTA